MPHKRNPVLTENLTGLARFVRAQALPAMENVALWHERDISHSSVERMIAPDVTITLDFALHRLAGVIEKLVVYPERMMANIEGMGGLVHSQRILLALTQAGMSREDAYRVVQTNAMAVWHEAGSCSTGCWLTRRWSRRWVKRRCVGSSISATTSSTSIRFSRGFSRGARVGTERSPAPVPGPSAPQVFGQSGTAMQTHKRITG